MNINIVDAIMGAGKTSSAINFINSSDDDTHFMYITPYLDETDRIRRSCPTKNFRSPDEKQGGSKSRHIKTLIEKGCNIATTHALFSLFDEEIMNLVYINNYTLIMDEVAEIIKTLAISSHDLADIMTNYTTIIDGHLLKWTVPDYNGEFNEYKRLCDLDCVGIYDDVALVWLFPVATFRAFQSIYVLTYLFEAQTQKYYYDFYGLTYTYFHVSGNSLATYNFTPGKADNRALIAQYRTLATICETTKLNLIGEHPTALSATWYDNNYKKPPFTVLKNNLTNFFKNKAKAPSNQTLWTCYKGGESAPYKKALAGKGYAKGYAPSNARATNAYRDRTAIAYPINRYFNPYVKNFFTKNGITVNEDAFALSEMLQFLWRSAIRDGQPVTLYIPSSRMRKLFEMWCDSVF